VKNREINQGEGSFVTAIDTLGLAVWFIPVGLAVLYLFKRDIYRKLDKTTDRVVRTPLGGISVSIAIIIIFGGLLTVAVQFYLLFNQGKWINIPSNILFKDEVFNQILSFFVWLYNYSHVKYVVGFLMTRIPFSVFLILTGLLIFLVTSPTGDENNSTESPPNGEGPSA
jgi:hypothetical protein